jgi:uncharacterized phage-associated protein
MGLLWITFHKVPFLFVLPWEGRKMSDIAANEEKLIAAIAYITRNRAVGKVKLFKLLYLADFTAYVELGEPITGEVYENFEMGPVPVTLWKNFDRITKNCVDIELVDTGLPQPEQQMRAKSDLDFGILSQSQQALLDRIDQMYGHMSGADLKRLTHQEVPYRATKRGEMIPYYLAAYRNVRKPTEREIKQIVSNKALMERLGKRIAGRKN